MCVRCQSAMLVLQADATESEISTFFPDFNSSNPSSLSLEERLLLATATQHENSDAPLCEVCMQSGISELSRSVDFARNELNQFRACLEELGPGREMDLEIGQLEDQLKQLEVREELLKERIKLVESEEHDLDIKEADVYRKWLKMQMETLDKEEDVIAVDKQIAWYQSQLKKLRKTNIISELFFIWHEGPFGSINGLRLGKLPPERPVSWTEINAALGQVCLLFDVVIKKSNVPLGNFRLLPRGSYSAIIKKDDKSILELYTGEGGLARFFSGRKFDAALVALITIVSEVIVFFQRTDRAIRVPYKIEGDKIGGLPVTLQFNSDEKWTQAMKYLLTDAKWLITWVVEKGM